MRFLWFIGSLCVLAGIAIVGYQGGELTYGEDHYAKEFARLFPEAMTAETEEMDSEAASPPSESSISSTVEDANSESGRDEDGEKGDAEEPSEDSTDSPESDAAESSDQSAGEESEESPDAASS